MRLYYEHAGIQIWHGDCREILPQLEYDCVITDPVWPNCPEDLLTGGEAPYDLFADFWRLRSAKKLWIPHGQQIALRQLAGWHAAGYDTAYILDEATLKGWRGLFVSERTPRALRDREGNRYRVTAEGTREYLQWRE